MPKGLSSIIAGSDMSKLKQILQILVAGWHFIEVKALECILLCLIFLNVEVSRLMRVSAVGLHVVKQTTL